MVRATYRNADMDIFLTDEDIIGIGFLEIVENARKPHGISIRHKPLEIQLSGDPVYSKVVIQKEDFEDYGDGIKVERNDLGFYIRLNDNAYWRMRDALGPPTPTLRTLGGTRYQNGDKINLWQEDQR